LLNPKRKKKKKTEWIIEFSKSEHVQQYAIVKVLDYVYSGQCDISTNFTPPKAIEVLKLAGIYKMEGLYQFCVKYIHQSITDKNISNF